MVRRVVRYLAHGDVRGQRGQIVHDPQIHRKRPLARAVLPAKPPIPIIDPRGKQPHIAAVRQHLSMTVQQQPARKSTTAKRGQRRHAVDAAHPQRRVPFGRAGAHLAHEDRHAADHLVVHLDQPHVLQIIRRIDVRPTVPPRQRIAHLLPHHRVGAIHRRGQLMRPRGPWPVDLHLRNRLHLVRHIPAFVLSSARIDRLSIRDLPANGQLVARKAK